MSNENLFYEIDIETETALLTERLETLQRLQKVYPELPSTGHRNPQSFASSLLTQYYEKGSLSNKQWVWVGNLVSQVDGREPLYGSFNAVLVMFRLAASNSHGRALKKPKVRLMTDDDIYLTLVFDPEETSEVKMYTGGYSSHGRRQFAGWIKEDCIVPCSPDRVTESMKALLQDFALDPQRVALAMAKKLGVCMYCGSELTDDTSKHHGYGPVCAENYNLPYGKFQRRERREVDLGTLFA